MAPILEVDGLTAGFPSHAGSARVLHGVEIAVEQGEVVGIVGESGSGKTMTALSVLQLLPPACHVEAGEILFRGDNRWRWAAAG
jgi:peptide/nickel transport system ATP-binding protein